MPSSFPWHELRSLLVGRNKILLQPMAITCECEFRAQDFSIVEYQHLHTQDDSVLLGIIFVDVSFCFLASSQISG